MNTFKLAKKFAKNLLGFEEDYEDVEISDFESDVEQEVQFDGQQQIDRIPTPVIVKKELESNILFLGLSKEVMGNADKRIVVKGKHGEWDFLTLYKTLMYIQHTNEIPKKINNRNLLDEGLQIRETKNYHKEMIQMRNYFINRYNLLKNLEGKLQSLKFIKNGQYINADKTYKRILKKLANNEYVEEIKFIMNQQSLSEDDRKKLENYQTLIRKQNQYKTVILGKSINMLVVKQKKVEQQQELYKIIEKVNQDYKNKKINDSKYVIKKIIANKSDSVEQSDELLIKNLENLLEDTRFTYKNVKPKKITDENIYLKSKMIFHLQNFLDISTDKAVSLLENNIFDTLIKVDMNKTNEKLNLIQTELNEYKEILEYLYALQNKTYCSPYSTFTSNLDINVKLHITHYHGKEMRNDGDIRNVGFDKVLSLNDDAKKETIDLEKVKKELDPILKKIEKINKSKKVVSKNEKIIEKIKKETNYDSIMKEGIEISEKINKKVFDQVDYMKYKNMKGQSKKNILDVMNKDYNNKIPQKMIDAVFNNKGYIFENINIENEMKDLKTVVNKLKPIQLKMRKYQANNILIAYSPKDADYTPEKSVYSPKDADYKPEIHLYENEIKTLKNKLQKIKKINKNAKKISSIEKQIKKLEKKNTIELKKANLFKTIAKLEEDLKPIKKTIKLFNRRRRQEIEEYIKNGELESYLKIKNMIEKNDIKQSLKNKINVLKNKSVTEIKKIKQNLKDGKLKNLLKVQSMFTSNKVAKNKNKNTEKDIKEIIKMIEKNEIDQTYIKNVISKFIDDIVNGIKNYDVFENKNKVKQEFKERIYNKIRIKQQYIKDINKKYDKWINEVKTYDDFYTKKQDELIEEILKFYINKTDINQGTKNIVYDQDTYLTPILLIEPLPYQGKYMSMYDEFIGRSKNEVLHHDKQLFILGGRYENELNELTKKYNDKVKSFKGDKNKIRESNELKLIKQEAYKLKKLFKNKKLPKRVIDKMVPYDISVPEADFVKVQDDTELVMDNVSDIVNNKAQIIKKKLTKKQRQVNEKILTDFFETLIPVVYYKPEKGKTNPEFNKLKSIKDKIIKQASKFHNINIAKNWIHSGIVNHYMNEKLNELNNIKIIIEQEKGLRQKIEFSNIDNVIRKLPLYVSIDDEVLIENGKFVDNEKEKIEMDLEKIKMKIKREIFLNKIKKFTKKLKRRISVTINGDVSRLNIDNTINKLFEKILDQQKRKLLTDRKGSDKMVIIPNQGKSHTDYEDSYINFCEGLDDFIYKINSIDNSNIYSHLTNKIEISKKEVMRDIDEHLYYVLLSFLDNKNQAVEHTYQILEGEQDSMFTYKNEVWNWYKKYSDVKERDPQNFRKITIDSVIEKLFPDNMENNLDRWIMQHKVSKNKTIFELTNFNKYLSKSDKTKREEIIAAFLSQSFERGIVRKQDYKLYLASIFLDKLNQAIELSPNNTLNPVLIYRYLRVLNVYTEKPQIFERVKKGVSARRVVGDKKEERQDRNKDDLLNNFMKLTEENMEKQLNENVQGNNDYTEDLNQNNNFDLNDDEENQIQDYEDIVEDYRHIVEVQQPAANYDSEDEPIM